jgi:hypothetical protein
MSVLIIHPTPALGTPLTIKYRGWGPHCLVMIVTKRDRWGSIPIGASNVWPLLAECTYRWKRVLSLEEKKKGTSFFLFSSKEIPWFFTKSNSHWERFPSLWDKETLRTDEGSSVVSVFRQSYNLVVDLQSKAVYSDKFSCRCVFPIVPWSCNVL